MPSVVRVTIKKKKHTPSRAATDLCCFVCADDFHWLAGWRMDWCLMKCLQFRESALLGGFRKSTTHRCIGFGCFFFFFVCSLSTRFSFLVCANFLTRFVVAYLPCLTTRNALCPQGRRCVSASPRLYSNQSIGTNYVIHQGGHGICHGTERTRYCAYYLLVQPVTLLVQVIVFVNGMACCCCCYAPESVCLFSYVFVSLPQ